MIKQDIISAEAERLGFTKHDLDIIFNYENKNNDLLGWQVIAFYENDNKKLEKLRDFIIELEYEKCVNEMIPDVTVITNIINL